MHDAGSFDKFAKVTMVAPLTGVQYSDKVANNCVNHWKEIGIYTDAEAEAVAEFKEVFKPRNFPPGASLLFAFSASGALSVSIIHSYLLTFYFLVIGGKLVINDVNFFLT